MRSLLRADKSQLDAIINSEPTTASSSVAEFKPLNERRVFIAELPRKQLAGASPRLSRSKAVDLGSNHASVQLLDEPLTMTPTSDEAQLIPEQFALLLSHRGRTVARRFFRWAKSRGISRSDARDAAQDVLHTLVRRVQENRVTPGMLSSPWLFRCAMRRAIRNHLKSAAVRSQEQHANPASGKWEQYRQTIRCDQLDAIIEGLNQLSQRDRAVLTLHHVDKRTEREIADLFDVVQGTVSRWLAGARARLRHAVVLVLIRQGYTRDELPF